MSVSDVLIRSICGYIFVIPGVLLYFFCLRKSGRGRSAGHVVLSLVFCYYLIGILTMTGIHAFRPLAPRLVLIPFAGMASNPVDAILNAILFFPLGLFLPLLFRRYGRLGPVAVAGAVLSLGIELAQLFGMGTTDINDWIANTAGACLGYAGYRLLSGAIRRELLETVQADGIGEHVELWLFAAYSFAVMTSVQPVVIHTLFRLG